MWSKRTSMRPSFKSRERNRVCRFEQNKKPPRDETWRPFDELINSNRWVRGYGHCGKKFAAKVPGEV
jgi:hypothetical protein